MSHQVIDLEKEFFALLVKAAGESNWIPHDYYFVNDWVSDCCRFLRTGQGISNLYLDKEPSLDYSESQQEEETK